MAPFELTPAILLLSFFLVGAAIWAGSYIVFFARKKPDKGLKLLGKDSAEPKE
ncbi:MAG: hypothetical protein P4N41_00585 [Negativicutes bacterium]|nr:hypothetical protein [Negativicutes bacterium]